MSGERTRPDRLDAYRRWQSAELEEAKVRMARMNEIATQKRTVVDRIENEIVDLHALVREQANGSAPLSAEALLRLSTFNSHQQRRLRGARDLHTQATQQADDAQQGVVHVFERLSVVERLLERRQELAGRQEQRSLQKRLDEGALSRTPTIHRQTTTPEE